MRHSVTIPRYTVDPPMSYFHADIGFRDPEQEEQEDINKKSKINAKPKILVDQPTYMIDGEIFHIMNTMGQASSGGVTVYRALQVDKYCTDHVRDLRVALKCVHIEKQPDIFIRLQLQVGKSCFVGNHANVMRFRKDFCCNGYYVVVLPYMDLGSLRSLMADRFPRGIPETYTLHLLYHTLKGLSAIHKRGHIHGEISAGHIFVDSRGGVKLAYSASVYDLVKDENQDLHSPFMPPALSCYWAAAPEVYNNGSASHKARKAADIWLIGITALELVYGGLRFVTREKLEAMLVEINIKKRLRLRSKFPEDRSKEEKRRWRWPFLPSCLNKEKEKEKENRVFSFSKEEKRRWRWPFLSSCLNKEKELFSFSKGFVEMVVKCLDFDPINRPTADELLQYKIFDRARRNYFD